jgi:hypothetical protein
MRQVEHIFRKWFVAIVGCGICALLSLTWALVKGALPPHVFPSGVVILDVPIFAAFLFSSDHERN